MGRRAKWEIPESGISQTDRNRMRQMLREGMRLRTVVERFRGVYPTAWIKKEVRRLKEEEQISERKEVEIEKAAGMEYLWEMDF